LMEPKVQHFHLGSSVLPTETDLREWLARRKKPVATESRSAHA
jgi:hypothetical protein